MKTYSMTICRKSLATYKIEVRAESFDEACGKALDQVLDVPFEECGADYTLEGIKEKVE